MKYLPSNRTYFFENTSPIIFYCIITFLLFSIFSLVFSPFRVKIQTSITPVKTGVSHLFDRNGRNDSFRSQLFYSGRFYQYGTCESFSETEAGYHLRSDVSHRCAGRDGIWSVCFSSDRYHLRHTGGEDRRCNFYHDRRLRQERDRCSARRLDCLRLKGTDARPFLRRYRRHRGQ